MLVNSILPEDFRVLYIIRIAVSLHGACKTEKQPPRALRCRNASGSALVSNHRNHFENSAEKSASWLRSKIPLYDFPCFSREGDFFNVMSDGLPEMRDQKGNMLDYETPEKILEKYVHLNQGEVINAFEKEISEFSKGSPLADDIRMIVLKKRD